MKNIFIKICLFCEGVKKMRVKNFSDDFMEVPKIGNLKSFTLSCNARNFSNKNPL